MENLQQQYTRKAYTRLGIRPADWNPDLGYRHNRYILDEMYYYYQQVYLLQPNAFYWMGLARLTGGQVLWGMDHLQSVAKDPSVLTCQIVAAAKHIFDNLSWQHELFLDNPEALMKAVQQLDTEVAHTHAYARCWQLIVNNDAADIDEGNRLLLYNEQCDTIQPHYNTIKLDPYSRKRFWFTRFVMRQIHPAHRRFIIDQPFEDVTCFGPRWQWIDGPKGMWRSWVDTPDPEKIKLVSLSNEAVMWHRWN